MNQITAIQASFRRRPAVLIIGSGVSRHSVGRGEVRPPTWKRFLEGAINDCPQQVPAYVKAAIEGGDLLHACEWIKKRFDEEWAGYLRKKFQEPRFTPSEIHQKILRLDCRILFSLNFDDIYERAAHEVAAGSHIVKNYYDSDVSEYLRGDGRYIVKIHGSLNSPNNLIFTQRDYADARVNHSAFYQSFDATLLTHTVIFIGAGYSDPDVSLILENQNFSFPTSQPHYFVSGKQENKDMKYSLRRNRNLKVLEYDKKDENHSGLISEIGELVNLVDERREAMRETTNW